MGRKWPGRARVDVSKDPAYMCIVNYVLILKDSGTATIIFLLMRS